MNILGSLSVLMNVVRVLRLPQTDTSDLSTLSSAPGPPPSSEVPAGLYPFMVRSSDGRQVPVVQAYAFGKYLGYLKVTFDDAGNVLTSTGNPVLLDSSVPQGKEDTADPLLFLMSGGTPLASSVS